jgi:hypothetical protein
MARQSDNFVNDGFDLLEGVVAGGVVGIGTEIIASAVATLPHAFLSVSEVAPVSVVVGALVFVGVAIKQMRDRRS